MLRPPKLYAVRTRGGTHVAHRRERKRNPCLPRNLCSPVRIRRVALVLALAVCAAAEPGFAQWTRSLPLAVELGGSLAAPLGEFADPDGGIGAEAGPELSGAVLLRVTPGLALSVGYSRIWFQCERCAVRDIDDSVVSSGFDGGFQAQLPLRLGPVAPWIAAGAVFHELIFSGDESSLSSDNAWGLRAGGGVALPMPGPLMLKPGVHYTRYNAELDLGEFPGESVDVAHFALNLRLVYEF